MFANEQRRDDGVGEKNIKAKVILKSYGNLRRT